MLVEEVSLDELSFADTAKLIPSNRNIKLTFILPVTCLPEILLHIACSSEADEIALDGYSRKNLRYSHTQSMEEYAEPKIREPFHFLGILFIF